jgi:hypothetical protein
MNERFTLSAFYPSPMRRPFSQEVGLLRSESLGFSEEGEPYALFLFLSKPPPKSKSSDTSGSVV